MWGINVKKKILIFVLMLILSISLSHAIKTITVDETDLVSLKLDAIDADEDVLFYGFTEPLDENGQWQTTYGDVGEYQVTVTVSDGQLETSDNVELIVNKKNMPPTLDSFIPEETEITINEWGNISFEIIASDLNNDPLIYEWRLDGEIVSEKEDYIYKSDYGDAGTHRIIIIISDGEEELTKEWIIQVNKVDRKLLLDNIQDITATEGDIIQLDLPNFKKYNLQYDIEGRIDNNNYWETGYDDAGIYDITITIKDRSFTYSKTIKIEVIDKDRPPVFKSISNAWLNENQQVTIELEAEDPDGDLVEFFAENMPPGASLNGNKFEWTTDYDTVTKENFLDKTLDKFHLLYNPSKVTFTAKSKEIEVIQKVLIMVKDVNRAPLLQDLSPITVNEGENLLLKPEAEDPDGDSISYSYSGWTDINPHTTTYEDAGTYKVKVTAYDGFLTDEKFVTITVNDVNRAPVFGEIGNIEINENEKLELSLYVNDPDGDSVNISSDVLLRNSTIENNVFIWTPDYGAVNTGAGLFTVKLIASDGEIEVFKEINITVYNVNRKPEITSFIPKGDFNLNISKKVKFEINAEDPDGDELTYIWKFGLLEQYSSGSAMVRKFTSSGIKRVKVIVSDGEEEAEHEWLVNVIGPVVKKIKKVVKKPVVKKPVVKTIVKIKKPVKPKEIEPVPKPKSRESDIYGKYTIVHSDDKGVIEESKESLIVWRD
jgi:PKD repeat protein